MNSPPPEHDQGSDSIAAVPVSRTRDVSAAVPLAQYRSAPLEGDRLFRLSLGDQIAATLRDEIVHGLIPPGTHLVQADLCERFGTSRMPVRDALQQLDHDGLLVERAGQREVVALGKDALLDAYLLIAVLHGWAARLAAESASDEGLSQLDALYQRAIRATTAAEHGQLAWLWHREVNILSGSTRLFRTIAMVQGAVPRVYPSPVRDLVPSKRTLTSMMDVIRDRNGDEAEQLVRFHSIQSAHLIVDHLTTASPDLRPSSSRS